MLQRNPFRLLTACWLHRKDTMLSKDHQHSSSPRAVKSHANRTTPMLRNPGSGRLPSVVNPDIREKPFLRIELCRQDAFVRVQDRNAWSMAVPCAA